MERMAWSDARLDDLARRMDAGFERVDADLRELRSEVGSLRGRMDEGFEAVNRLLFQIGGGIIVGLVGVIAAVLLRA